ncbi:MAG: hypothetical protein WC786_06470 [Patescibacteria group bacterium]
MQTVNRTDTERVWINITNSDSAVLSNHSPVFRILGNANPASVATNEGAGSFTTTGRTTNQMGGLVGLAYEDIAVGDVGAVQVYGYHESFTLAGGAGAITIRPGMIMGPFAATSLGIDSVGVKDAYGPFVALDTVTTSTAAVVYGNHVFIRCL